MAVPTCAQELEKLYGVIMQLGAGKSVTGITFGERQVSYTPNQLKDVQGLYRIFWRQCGAEAGLPDLSAQASVERGPPGVMRKI